MSLLGKIFGGGSIVKDGLQLIDDMHTSTQEEIQEKAKAKVALLTAYAPFKLAQRVIAFAFTFVYLGSFLFFMGITVANEGLDLSAMRSIIAEFKVGEIMLLITLFYFGGGATEGIINSIVNKKK